MKIILTRKEHQCRLENCCFGKTIQRGAKAVTQSYKGSQGFFILHFHPECYIQSMMSYIHTKSKELDGKIELRRQRKSKGSRGRPPRFIDLAKRLEYRNLRCLLKYHQKVDNKAKVKEIKAKIKKMEEEL